MNISGQIKAILDGRLEKGSVWQLENTLPYFHTKTIQIMGNTLPTFVDTDFGKDIKDITGLSETTIATLGEIGFRETSNKVDYLSTCTARPFAGTHVLELRPMTETEVWRGIGVSALETLRNTASAGALTFGTLRIGAELFEKGIQPENVLLIPLAVGFNLLSARMVKNAWNELPNNLAAWQSRRVGLGITMEFKDKADKSYTDTLREPVPWWEISNAFRKAELVQYGVPKYGL